MGKPRVVVARHGKDTEESRKPSARVICPGAGRGASVCTAVRLVSWPSPTEEPRTVDIPLAPVNSFVERATQAVADAIERAGGRLPLGALRELIANLFHAHFRDVSIVVSAGGNEVLIADRGPGLADKEKALQPGYTTATDSLRRHIRGAGLGLPRAQRIAMAGGAQLVLDDNIGGGTVVRLVGSQVSPPPLAAEVAVLSEREKRVLLLLAEEGPGGPSLVAQGLDVSLSTAHRLLQRLEKLGLVVCNPKGKRDVSPYALNNFERLVRTGS
jgi:DNA-binding CsgD family transcriptional regulator